MASAAAWTLAWLTSWAKQFQLFQPMGGVRAMRSPTTNVRSRSADPLALVACRRTAYVPGVATAPVTRPVAGSRVAPAGRPSAANRTGFSPVATTVYRTGCPGRTPNAAAELIRGTAGGGGVRTSAASAGGSAGTGLAPS